LPIPPAGAFNGSKVSGHVLRARKQLVPLLEFCRREGIEVSSVAEVLKALDELANGRTKTILAPRRKEDPGKPGSLGLKPAQADERAAIAAFVWLLVKAGHTVAQAAQRVATDLPQHKPAKIKRYYEEHTKRAAADKKIRAIDEAGAPSNTSCRGL
jgi:hypothetical protein